jgi:molybdate transport system substrate-binding protein
MTGRRLLAASAACLVLLAGCSKSSPPTGGGHQTLTVLAAASLTEAFQAIGHQFAAGHDGVTVRFSFGPSDGLAQQIQQGAPADVFASASSKWMDAVAQDPGVRDRHDFARNRLTVVVPAANPAGITSIADLAKPGVKLVLAAEGVPAGDYAREVLDNAGISAPALANLVSNEVDVKGVLQKVAAGEADAGIVYVTDVTPDVRNQVKAIPIPDAVNVIATYPIGVVTDSKDQGLALQFERYVLGPGQSQLRNAGFLSAS